MLLDRDATESTSFGVLSAHYFRVNKSSGWLQGNFNLNKANDTSVLLGSFTLLQIETSTSAPDLLKNCARFRRRLVRDAKCSRETRRAEGGIDSESTTEG